MKQGKVILFDIIVGVVVCLMCISFSAKDMIIQTVNEGAIGQAVAIRIMDVVDEAFPDTPIDTLVDIQEALGNSEALDTITGKYIDAMSDAISNNQVPQYPDISNDLVTLANETINTIENHLNIEISESQQQVILSQLLEKSQDIESSIQTYTDSLINTSYLPAVQSMLMKMYQFITSWIFRFILLIVLIMSVYLIVFWKQSLNKIMMHLGIPVFIVGIVVAWIIPSIAQSIGFELTNHFLGRAMYINTGMMQIIGMIVLVIGIALVLISKIIQRQKQTV
ncbi:hypothetical protein B5E48_01820 [Massilimicrobiota sp. An105]|uniref:hypothetical protein n=1 Tax=Massilimicrobiota sp. An105 TaxID=1965540 RepID=UPI000B3AE5D1|nr:hypothetical protein [Massilimicrobiota sp. An105]OUQ84161.1 hypothetical protein B5E48_01820 [Massilimicrobiota sp. An105]